MKSRTDQTDRTDRAAILNRDWQHPADGWYMIEPRGNHVNRAANVVQVIDDQAVSRVVEAFNAANRGPNPPGMLVDHEHFSHDADKETRAYGWLQELQGRPEGIFGRIRWTETGKAAVDGGDYRFFSTEYSPDDLEPATIPLKNTKAVGNLKVVRPRRLAGLTLTNRPNNQGQTPITNRDPHPGPLPSDGRGGKQFAGAASAASAAEPKTKDKKTNMTSIATKLGLAAEASEQAVLEAVTNVMNRATEAEGKIVPLQERIKTLEAEQVRNREAQADADLAPFKDKLSEEDRKLIRAQLIANREATLPLLKLALPAESAAPRTDAAPKLVVNRGTAKTPADPVVTQATTLNREVRSYQDAHKCSYERAFNAVRESKPELFSQS